jgi:delta14-sterol reductase
MPDLVPQLLPGAILFTAFVGGIFLLGKIVPGPEQAGAPLKDGSRILYPLNGLRIFVLLAAALVGGIASGHVSLTPLLDNFWGLFVAANVFSFGLSAILQVVGRRKRGAGEAEEPPPVASLGAGGAAHAAVAVPSPVALLREYFMGAELNPSFLGVDLKMFSYRPSLMGLFVLNLAFASAQLERHGELSTAMILYQLFTFIYVFNYFQFEHGMLYTWDVIAENFGWMLVWGDYAFVPFAYSVIGWYLVDDTSAMHPALAVALPCLFVFGLWVFRGANQQKDQFKRDPTAKIWGKTPETLGGKILVSGFWGIGRKLNYAGEITVYTSWALLSGAQSFVPYILPVWLFCLLTHRAWRDEQRCRQKYGALWDEYCRRARFRMIPFVY